MRGEKKGKKKQKYEIVYIPVDVDRYMKKLENKKRREKEQILYKNLSII